MYIFSDLLVLVMLVKLLWDVTASKTLPWEWFAISVAGLPFLLGLGGRSANRVLREGLSVASLFIFISLLAISGLQIVFVALLCVALLFYLFGRFTRVMFGSIVVAALIVIIIIFILARQ